MDASRDSSVRIEGSAVTGSAFATGKKAKARARNKSGDSSAVTTVSDAAAKLRSQLEGLQHLDADTAAAVDAAVGQLLGLEREVAKPKPERSRVLTLMSRIREAVGDITLVSTAVTALQTAVTALVGS